MTGTFISYRRDDSAGYAGRLHEELEQRLGIGRVFRDVESLPVGHDFVDMINLRLQQCDSLVAVISRDWLTARTASGALRLEQPDDFVVLEIAAGLARPDVLVVPVLVGGATMPAASQLPQRIRALSRRHAITLRDETWETDVDRLVAVLRRATARSRLPSRRAVVRGVSIALVAVAAALVLQNADLRDGSRSEPETARPAVPTAALPPSTATIAYAIDIPSVAEIAHDSLIYTLISGNVAPRGNSNGVRLRFRVSNEGTYDANLWDASFRLAIGDEVLTPTGGLNEIIAGRSIKQAFVTFNVPSRTSRAVLRILGGKDPAELPLDLSPTGRVPEDERADAGDALSRARTAWVLRDPRPLIAGNGFSATLVRVTSRLFVNTLRIRVRVRLINEGRYPMHTGVLTLRLAHGGAVAAPVSAPNAAIDSGSTFSDDFVFEIPPTTKNIERQASAGNDSAKVPLEVR